LSAGPTLPPIINAATLRMHVQFSDLIEPVAAAFCESSAGLAENGLIVAFPGSTREAGDVYVKTGVLRGHRVFVTKVSPWFAVNLAERRPQGGFIAVFDATTGHTMAILDEQHYLSDIRTAAAGAIAARLLCSPSIRRAAVIGAGVQAYWQALALHYERPYEKLTIWARDTSKAQVLADQLRALLPAVSVAHCEDLESTVREADAVITATQSRQAIVQAEWLHPGQHITAVGADDATKCELSAGVLGRARVFVDDVATSTRNGDVGRAIEAGQYSTDKLAGEIGEVVAGHKAGRTSPEQITVAKLVGIGAQDLVAAEVALMKLGLLS
jgi:ornithine cyclodeaminase/alanine dehydrogenase-like protein (mu-crystallin family)